MEIKLEVQNPDNLDHTQEISVAQAAQEDILRPKCPIHRLQRCDLLHLDSTVKQHRICIQCAQMRDIPLTQILSIGELVEADANTYLSSYPALTDPNIISQVKNTFETVNNIIRQVELRFENLKEQIQKEFAAAYEKAKRPLLNLQSLYKKLEDTYASVSDIDQFKKVIQNSITKPELLSEYIIAHCKESSRNTELILKDLRPFQVFSKAFDTKAFLESQKIILDLIKGIDFFDGFEKKVIEFQPHEKSDYELARMIDQGIKFEEKDFENNKNHLEILPSSQYRNSDTKLKLKYEESGRIIISSKGNKKNLQCFINKVIQRNEKYILRFELIHNNSNRKKLIGFSVGLTEASQRFSTMIHYSDMSYCECAGGFGIDRIVKGRKLFSNHYSKISRQMEMRIHLARRYLRIGNYPDYSSVVEISDPNLIKEGMQYYVGFFVGWPGDVIKIIDMIQVPEFDNLMDS